MARGPQSDKANKHDCPITSGPSDRFRSVRLLLERASPHPDCAKLKCDGTAIYSITFSFRNCVSAEDSYRRSSLRRGFTEKLMIFGQCKETRVKHIVVAGSSPTTLSAPRRPSTACWVSGGALQRIHTLKSTI